MENRSQTGWRADADRGASEFRPATSTDVPLQPSPGQDDTTSGASDVASSLAADLKDSAKTATRAVKQQASQFAADMGHEFSKTAEHQKMRGVEAIQCFARAINSAAAELEGQSPRVAQSVRDAAAKVESLSGNISSRNVDELIKAATELARSQPMLFIGGAVAAGFAMSRFLKSSTNKQSPAENMQTSSPQSWES